MEAPLAERDDYVLYGKKRVENSHYPLFSLSLHLQLKSFFPLNIIKKALPKCRVAIEINPLYLPLLTMDCLVFPFLIPLVKFEPITLQSQACFGSDYPHSALPRGRACVCVCVSGWHTAAEQAVCVF